MCKYVPFVALPVNEFYPQHGWDGRSGSQQMNLLITEPELCGVIWGEITKALFVLGPVLVEVHTAVTSLWTQKRDQNHNLLRQRRLILFLSTLLVNKTFLIS